MTMNNGDKFIKEIKTGFQNNKGKGSVYCFSDSIIPKLVYEIISGVKSKNPDRTVLVVTEDCSIRQQILSYKYIEDIKILSKTYINTNYKYCYDCNNP